MFEVSTDDGWIVSVAPFSADPTPSSISDAIPKAVHHSSRVARPSIRKGWLNDADNRGRR